jgi:hypothetical protein
MSFVWRVTDARGRITHIASTDEVLALIRSGCVLSVRCVRKKRPRLTRG